MSKQDRQGARTVADLERKLNTRKTFAEVMGLAKKAKEAADEAKEKAEKVQSAVDGIDHEAIWNWLTENGIQQGFFKHEGQVYVNVAYLKGDKIAAELIDGSTLIITKGSTIAGWNIDNYSIFKTPDGKTYKDGTFMHVGTATKYSIGGSDEISGWVFGAGGKWGVTKEGAMYGEDVHLQGDITATGGNIGGWHIGVPGALANLDDGVMLYSDLKYNEKTKTQYGVALSPWHLHVHGLDETGASEIMSIPWYTIAKFFQELK